MDRLVRNRLCETAIEATTGFDELLEASDVRASEATGSIFPGYFDWVCELVGNERTNERLVGWMDEWMDRQTDRQTDRPTDQLANEATREASSDCRRCRCGWNALHRAHGEKKIDARRNPGNETNMGS